MTKPSRRRAIPLAATVSTLALALAAGIPLQASAAAAPAPAGPEGPSAAAEVSEVIVNGIPYKETVLPTRLSTNSVYGLDLSVMDTPRNTTLLSTAQLRALNIQDPRAFSYLTASSYTDSSFGTPNIPRIRGQYADVFYNGMRSSFTENGYGAPPNFDSFDNLAITKGPASVIDGPGPGVGGEVDILTKRPGLSHFAASADATFDTISNRRWTVDVGGPLIPGELGVRISYSGEHSGSYFYDHFHDKQAVYVALRWAPNSQYQLDLSGEVNNQQYTENVGVNRVNQSLINNDQYLQGAPTGELYSALIGSPPLQIGSSGNPYSPLAPILTEYTLTNSVPLNTRITIDQAPGTWSSALTANAQLIQTYRVNDNLTIEDNAFFAYQDSENRENYYYADSSNGSWSFENRADVKAKFDVNFAGMTIKNEVVAGVTFRFAHVNYISTFETETPAAFDLTSNPKLWVWNTGVLTSYGNAFPYMTAFGHTQYGAAGRDSNNGFNTGISDLYDTGFFFQHRMEFSPQFSVLYGGRLDLTQNHSADPFGGAVCSVCFTTIYYTTNTANPLPLPQSHTTGVFGLGQGNLSVVYRPWSWVSSYATVDFTQSVNENGGEGGVNTFLQVPDSELMRSDSYLYEAGLKFNLLKNKLFAGLAVFDQKRNIPTGPSGTSASKANIRGVEIEMNYQPTRNLFATASYSYIKTTLNAVPAQPFYNYPAQPGVNIDGAGLFAVFAGGKVDDPGVPQQIFNFLGNYKFDNGLGFRFGVQVTGPIEATYSGQLNLAASSYVPASIVANGGYYQSPVIPWQYSMNTSVFYEWKAYTLTVSVYNLTDRLNWQSSPPFYGNDFLVRNDPRTFEIRLQAKF